jgi:hypothetical protein
MLANPVDRWLAELDGAALTWEDLPRILSVHYRFTDLFKAISGRAQRSLASKYLHFHRPGLFFLYDPRAETTVRSEVPSPRRVALDSAAVDRGYALFARRCLELKERLEPDAPLALDPRALDRCLLSY